MKETLANSQTAFNQGSSVPFINYSIDPTFSSKVKPNSTINADKVFSSNNTSPVLPPKPKTNSFIDTLQVGDKSMGLSSAEGLQKDVTTAQGSVDDTTAEIKKLLGQLGYQADDVAKMQSQADIVGKQGSLTDLNTQYAQKRADYLKKENAITGQGIATPFKQGQLALERVQAQTELGSLAAQIQAAQGNLETAFSTIDQTIKQKYTPIQDQLNTQLKYYELNKDKLSSAQKALADRQVSYLEARKDQVKSEQKVFEDAYSSINQAIKDGTVDSTVGFKALGEMLNGKLPSEVLSSLGIQTNAQASNLASAISSVESSGNYQAVGRTLTKGENAGYAALGKYQIMPNIWFASIGLDPNSEADKNKFLNTPELQEQLFTHIIETLQKQYGGDNAKAVAAYFGGADAAKAYGTSAGDKMTDGNMSVNEYVNSVLGKIPKDYSNIINVVKNMETTVAGKNSVQKELTKSLQQGDYKTAYNQILNTVENSITGEAKQRFSNARTDAQVMLGLKNAIQKYSDNGGDMGLLKGTAEQIERKLGQVKNPALATLAVQLQREFQTYRNTMTGAAFGPDESREYASVNPTTNKSLDLNLAVINGALNQLNNRIDSTVDSRVTGVSEIRQKAQQTGSETSTEGFQVSPGGLKFKIL
ncbi:MAG: transglycosylase SLT domain-containing protein [Minisyncoccia bacterium]